MNGKYFVAGSAIIGIAAIEVTALYQGINGVALSAAIGAICTIAGLAFGVKIGGAIEKVKKIQGTNSEKL